MSYLKGGGRKKRSSASQLGTRSELKVTEKFTFAWNARQQQQQQEASTTKNDVNQIDNYVFKRE